MQRPEGFEQRGADDPIVRVSHDDAPEPDEKRAVEPSVEPAEAHRTLALRRGQSYAQRTDQIMRDAERRAEAQARAAARVANREAQLAARAARRAERGEVRRFTAARRRARLYWLGGVVAAVVVFFGLVGLVYSPIMAVDEITVSGTQRVNPDEISQALESFRGQPIATVTDDEVRDRLAAFTGLQSYVVDIVPPGTIIVRVVERQPVALIALEDGPHMFDPAGVDLGPADETLPVVERVEPDSDPFGAIAAALVSVPEGLAVRITSVTATTTDDITMRLDDGSTVVWGSAADSALKADVLEALVAATVSEEPVTFDVRAPEHPVVR